MKSKMIEKRDRLATRVMAAAMCYADTVTQGLDEAFSHEEGGDEPMPDWHALQTIAGRRVDRVRIDLLETDVEQQAVLRKVRRLRRRRDDAAHRLFHAIQAFRSIFDATYGRGQCERLLGFAARPSRKPLRILNVTERGLERLRSPALELPLPALPGVRLDLKRVLLEIEGEVDVLGPALEELRELEHELRHAGRAKHQAIRRFDREMGTWSRLLEASYELAGEDGFAEDIRSFKRRR